MKLTEYSKDIKNYVEAGLRTIDQDGFVIGLNNDVEYWNKEEFLDACVENLVGVILIGEIEKDCDYSESMRLSGIIQGYMESTGIAGRVIRDRNPLGFLKKGD